ncbi:unknown [[Mannheimia] succiniciproducens MBEL55E]|uniref:Uncharacterized protein n=1 Tax=Mannheimia succiniciproducens (strain KCTC 0769BP / MBEL55E) TaxID=221988 RepID=Q65UG5_MANSM|nr:unknown [[Mannheimia] succiniciproducens MBEL55E]
MPYIRRQTEVKVRSFFTKFLFNGALGSVYKR